MIKNKRDGLSRSQFQWVDMNDIRIAEDLLLLNIFLPDIDNVKWKIMGEDARRNVQKYENIVRLLRYDNHLCNLSNVNAVSQSFRCPNCDTFFNRAGNLKRFLTPLSERVKNVYPRNVYHIRENLLDILVFFGIKYTSEQNLFEKFALVDFELICVQVESFKDTKATTSIGIHAPISVSNSTKTLLMNHFFCNSDPHHLIASFTGSLHRLAIQSKTQMIFWLFDIETTKKTKLGSIL